MTGSERYARKRAAKIAREGGDIKIQKSIKSEIRGSKYVDMVSISPPAGPTPS